MAAYRRVDDLTVTCRLTACTPGSAPGPTLVIEYGKPLPFYLFTVINEVVSAFEERRMCMYLRKIVMLDIIAGYITANI